MSRTRVDVMQKVSVFNRTTSCTEFKKYVIKFVPKLFLFYLLILNYKYFKL